MKTTLGLVAFMLLSLSSCNQDDGEVLVNSENQSLKVVNIVDGKILSGDMKAVGGDVNTMALQFPSEAELQNTLDKLSNMSVDERIAFTDNLGFVSLEKLLKIADEELDNIGGAATSETDFRTKYSTYKKKYGKMFVFNSTNSDDLSPYIPASTENDKLAYLVSGNYSIVIGSSIHEVGFSNNMREEDNLVYNKEESAQTRSVPVNGFIIKVGSKKTIFDAEIKSTVLSSTVTRKQMQYHFGAQKKMWYGWKRDSARDLIFTDLAMNLTGHYDRRHFTEAKGNFNFTGGYTDLRAGLVKEFTGTVYVWTDQTVEHDGNGNIIYIDSAPVLYRRPLCYENKAYACQISYTVSY